MCVKESMGRLNSPYFQASVLGSPAINRAWELVAATVSLIIILNACLAHFCACGDRMHPSMIDSHRFEILSIYSQY